MQPTLRNSFLFLGLMGICSAAPAGQDINLPVLTLPEPLPSTCYGVVDGVVKTPSCYTATVTKTVKPTKPTSCPQYECPPPKDDPIMCPMYIKVTSVAVPCSTDCCPSTPTSTVTTTSCPRCTTSCVIPTETITVTTGCKTTTELPWPTATLTVA
ncbi:hypothetical protein C7999DRAFT_28068 [Corynascus novoguineensis]|uniref:Uncharacterized protein n=1 Tax=Corynascus novoguineensis TaxID=1126955 RepID=A0AAN7CZP5_9PEZI|nr:hypothetical protein C7999DRAFT_28068 [Corynascus novoguineensis]